MTLILQGGAKKWNTHACRSNNQTALEMISFDHCSEGRIWRDTWKWRSAWLPFTAIVSETVQPLNLWKERMFDFLCPTK